MSEEGQGQPGEGDAETDPLDRGPEPDEGQTRLVRLVGLIKQG